MFSKKFFFCLSLILTFIIIDVVDSDAQSRRRRTRKVEEETISVPFSQKITHSIEIGNFGFGSGFSLSGKYSAGYKVIDRIQVGPSAKFFYNFVNSPNGSDFSLFDYGFGGFVRANIVRTIYFQAEYDYTSFDFRDTREGKSYPLVGLGYHDGNGPWTFGINLMFILNEEVRNISNNTVEYWISFNYNF